MSHAYFQVLVRLNRFSSLILSIRAIDSTKEKTEYVYVNINPLTVTGLPAGCLHSHTASMFCFKYHGYQKYGHTLYAQNNQNLIFSTRHMPTHVKYLVNINSTPYAPYSCIPLFKYRITPAVQLILLCYIQVLFTKNKTVV